MHQLFPFLDLGLVVTELPRDDLHSTGDLFLQAGLMLTFNTTLATTGPFDVGEVLGFVGYAGGLARLGGGGPSLGCDGICWKVLYPMKRKARVSTAETRIGKCQEERGAGTSFKRQCVPTVP